MDTISFNPERYQIEITNMMDKFFNDSILSFNPYEKDELFITNSSKKIRMFSLIMMVLFQFKIILVPYLISKVLKQTTIMVMIMN